jgi:hypothetical protein
MKNENVEKPQLNLADVSGSFLSPDDKNTFANWLISLKRDDLVYENFNGYEYRKEFKTIRQLYSEWYLNYR